MTRERKKTIWDQLPNAVSGNHSSTLATSQNRSIIDSMRSFALLGLLWLQAVTGGDDRRSLAEDAPPEVEMVTSLGSMRFMLTPQMTPATVSNFLAYVDDGFFDGLIFHRVIENFMVQGGGFDAAMHQRATRDPIPLEAPSAMSNGRGTIAMARILVPRMRDQPVAAL